MLKSTTVLAGLLLALSNPASTAYPDKPIRLISGYATGGSVDLAARVFAHHLSQELDTPVIVENRSGASGLIAASSTANAAADGYTLYYGVGATFTVMPIINEDSDAESLERLRPIGGIVNYTNVLLINDTVPVNTFSELIDYAKQNPDALTYGSSGIGSSSHLSGEYLHQLTGAPMMHVPYKGAAPAMTDVLGGQITMFWDVTATAQTHVQSGRVKPLAVSSTERNAMFPDVPTVAELGYPDYDVTSWFGLFGPAAMPDDVVDTLNGALRVVQDNPEFQEKMHQSGYVIFDGAPDEVSTRIKNEHELWKSVVAKAAD